MTTFKRMCCVSSVACIVCRIWHCISCHVLHFSYNAWHGLRCLTCLALWKPKSRRPSKGQPVRSFSRKQSAGNGKELRMLHGRAVDYYVRVQCGRFWYSMVWCISIVRSVRWHVLCYVMSFTLHHSALSCTTYNAEYSHIVACCIVLYCNGCVAMYCAMLHYDM